MCSMNILVEWTNPTVIWKQRTVPCIRALYIVYRINACRYVDFGLVITKMKERNTTNEEVKETFHSIWFGMICWYELAHCTKDTRSNAAHCDFRIETETDLKLKKRPLNKMATATITSINNWVFVRKRYEQMITINRRNIKAATKTH